MIPANLESTVSSGTSLPSSRKSALFNFDNNNEGNYAVYIIYILITDTDTDTDTVQYSTVRYSTVQYSTVQCSAVQYILLTIDKL